MNRSPIARKPESTGTFPRRVHGLAAAALLGGLAACATTGPIGPIATMAIDAGRRLLLNTADSNFGADYNDQFSRMLDLLMLREVNQTAEPAPVAGAGHPITPGDAPSAPVETWDTEASAPSYGGGTTPAATALVPIELEVVVVREVVIDDRPIPVAVEDGSVLRDGVGRPGDGDNLKIRFEANVACYVYAVWVDATAWATPLFPAIGGPNPVQAGKSYSLPAGNDWFYLDDYRGVENLYFVASHEPLDELDEVLASLAGRERSFRADVQRPAVVNDPGEMTRGLAGIRPGQASITGTDGADHPVATIAFISQAAEGDLVVTRWFRHE